MTVYEVHKFSSLQNMHLQVHFTVKIKLISGMRPIKITDTNTSAPNTCRRTFGLSPQSKPGTIPKLWHVKYSWNVTVVSSLVAIKYVNVVSPRLHGGWEQDTPWDLRVYNGSGMNVFNPTFSFEGNICVSTFLLNQDGWVGWCNTRKIRYRTVTLLRLEIHQWSSIACPRKYWMTQALNNSKILLQKYIAS